jgi:GntR family transcriptional regulator/MocR family aminotransferase
VTPPPLPDHGAADGGTAPDLLGRANRYNQIIIEDGYDSQLLDDGSRR